MTTVATSLLRVIMFLFVIIYWARRIVARSVFGWRVVFLPGHTVDIAREACFTEKRNRHYGLVLPFTKIIYIFRLFYWAEALIRHNTIQGTIIIVLVRMTNVLVTRYKYTARTIAQYFGHPFQQKWFYKRAGQSTNVLPLWQDLPD